MCVCPSYCALQRMIKLGDKTIEWDADFRLYLTSKLANPHYSPEIMGKTMIINYSVTMQGLENQVRCVYLCLVGLYVCVPWACPRPPQTGIRWRSRFPPLSLSHTHPPSLTRS
jgi:hypothetical protein